MDAPAYQGHLDNGNNPSGSCGNTPISDHRPSEQFAESLENAHPPVN